MADQWYSWHAGKVLGPVPREELYRLAMTGVLMPADLLWPQSGDPRDAVEVQAALDFSKLPPRVAAPAWLSDVQQALQAQPVRIVDVPDWVSDMEAAAAVTFSAPAPPAPPPQTPVRFKAPVAQLPPDQIPAAVKEKLPAAPPPTQGPPCLTLGGMSSVGRVRERNEDRFLIQQWTWNDATGAHEVALLVVADGMGGYQGGDEASALTARTVAAQIGAAVAGAMSGRQTDGAAVAAAVDHALHEANRVVLHQATTVERCKGMGATAAVVVIWGTHAYFGHVGDCRVYLHRSGELKQLTEDQTLVAHGRSWAVAPRGSRRARVAQRGHPGHRQTPDHRAVAREQARMRGDYLLLACDGLAAHVETARIQTLLRGAAIPAPDLARQLVRMADEGGGTDNCTVLIAQYA